MFKTPHTHFSSSFAVNPLHLRILENFFCFLNFHRVTFVYFGDTRTVTCFKNSVSTVNNVQIQTAKKKNELKSSEIEKL